MPANPLVNANISHVPTTHVHDVASCPSFASDVSSQRPDTVEPANTEDELRSTIKLYSDPLVWNRWLKDEPNPVFKLDEFHRDQHLRGLEGAVAIYFESILSPEDTERFDPPSGEEAKDDEPVDSDVGRRRVGRVQASSKAGNASGTRSQKAALSKDITDPKGSDKGQLLLGFGTYNAGKAYWCFKCYWVKRHPESHHECIGSDFEGERSVRTGHAQWHMRRDDITLETYNYLLNLVSHVGADVSHLRGRDREIAMWREGYVVVYPEHRAAKHLLNPTIGPLFENPQEAAALLDAANSSVETSILPPFAIPSQYLQQERAASSPASASNPTGPLATPFLGVMRPAYPTAAIPPQLTWFAEPVEHGSRANGVVFPVPPPIDPQLESTTSDPPPPDVDGQRVQSQVPEAPPPPSSGDPRRPRTQISGRRRDLPDSGRGTVDNVPRGTRKKMTNRAREALHQTGSSSHRPPSLTTDSTHTSSLPGAATLSEPTTPPKIEDDSVIGQANQILPEADQQGMGPIEPEAQDVPSPDILSSPFKMPGSANVMFGLGLEATLDGMTWQEHCPGGVAP